MEAFEHVVKVMLEAQGYVVTSNVKFPVRKRTRKTQYAEEQTHGYEVDLVAAKHNSLILGSVKSFFGSHGVSRQSFKGIADAGKWNHFQGYKLFNDKEIQEGVLQEAHKRYGYPINQMQLALFAGKFSGSDEPKIREHLGKMTVGGGPIKVVGLSEIVLGLIKAAQSRTYRNDPVIITLKALKEAGYLKH